MRNIEIRLKNLENKAGVDDAEISLMFIPPAILGETQEAYLKRYRDIPLPKGTLYRLPDNGRALEGLTQDKRQKSAP